MYETMTQAMALTYIKGRRYKAIRKGWSKPQQGNVAGSSRGQGTTPHGDRGIILRPRGKPWGSELIVQDLLSLIATHMSLDDLVLISGVLCVCVAK